MSGHPSTKPKDEHVTPSGGGSGPGPGVPLPLSQKMDLKLEGAVKPITVGQASLTGNRGSKHGTSRGSGR